MKASQLSVIATTTFKDVSVIVWIDDTRSVMMFGEIIDGIVTGESICRGVNDRKEWDKLPDETKTEVKQFAINEFEKLI